METTGPRICIIGSGTVGQATGKGLLLKGFNVTFIDTDTQKVESLRSGGYKAFLPSQIVDGQFNFDVSFLTVPTPNKEDRIDLSFLTSASRSLGIWLQTQSKYHLVVVKSTVPPGTTRSLVIKNIEKYSGKLSGRDFGACMNPEYLREKSALEDSLSPWLIVIGMLDEKSGEILAEVYRDFECPLSFNTLEEAEVQKYVHNLFNALKITFYNEMRQVCLKQGLDAEKVFPLVAVSCEGMWNPYYGIKDFGPFDGMCLPKDTQAFLSWAYDHKVKMPLLKTAIKINNELAALNQNGHKKVVVRHSGINRQENGHALTRYAH